MYTIHTKLVLLWAQLTKIYPLLPTSVQPISITKTLLIVPTKNERDPPLFTGKLLIKFQNILRNTTQDIIWHRVKILFSVISSPITLERQKWKSSKMKRGGSISFLVGTISNVLVMEIGWTDVGSGGYILVSCAHSNTSWYSKCKSSYTVYYLYFTLLFVLIRQGWTLRFLPTCPFELVVW
jgi:hypothetical protein